MKTGIATWGFSTDEKPLSELVADFADAGFEAVSFLPSQILRLDSTDRNRLYSVIRERELLVTVHGKCDLSQQHLTRQEVVGFLQLFGDWLYALTADAHMLQDSRGMLYDIRAIVHVLTMLEEVTRDTQLRFGMEDFPLDELALEFYHDALSPFLGCSRYGVLVDVGHMNQRVRNQEYFGGTGASEYFSRVPAPIIEAHLHDNRGDRDSHAYFGYGNIDFKAVADRLAAAGFSGVATMEVMPGLFDSTPDEALPRVKESLAAWRSYVGT